MTGARREKSGKDRECMKGATAYDDLGHAVGTLVELISDSLPSKLRAPRIPPARICAARRLARDASAHTPDRSASVCSTLQTLVRPTARSVPLGKCLSRSSVQLELSRSQGMPAESPFLGNEHARAPDRSVSGRSA